MHTTKTEAAPIGVNRESGGGLRLAYLLSVYPGVSHTFLLNEICELRKLGFTIDVASINLPDRPRDGLGGREQDEYAKTLYIKSKSKFRSALKSLGIAVMHPVVALRGLRAALSLDPPNVHTSIYGLFYLGEALILGQWIRKQGHHHLHVHFGGAVSAVGMLASIAWRVPYSLTIHGPDEFYDVRGFQLRQKVERARFVICISDYCRSQLMKISDPAHWSKMRVVRLGVDPDLFSPMAKKEDGDPVLEIACLGRLVPAKGQLVLLRAFATLLERGHRLRLRLVGDGSDRPRLEAFVDQRGLEGHVIFEGARNHDAARALLAHADVFVLASFAEGLPVALMEAMAMEIACVTTYVAGMPELIRDGLDGLLVPASSDEALAAAMERLILDSSLRKSLGASGRRRVLEHYHLSKNAAKLAASLAELCAQKPL